MCGAWLAFLPFVAVGAYAYWWTSIRQKSDPSGGGLKANLIFFGTVLAILLVVLPLCKP
jgi:hypothetical protein